MIVFIYLIVAVLLVVLIALISALSRFHHNVTNYQISHKEVDASGTPSAD